MVKKTKEINECDECGVNDVHTYGDKKNVIHNYICPYCEKELCKDCIRTVKLYSNNVNIQMIECCKDCYELKEFSIEVRDK